MGVLGQPILFLIYNSLFPNEIALIYCGESCSLIRDVTSFGLNKRVQRNTYIFKPKWQAIMKSFQIIFDCGTDYGLIFYWQLVKWEILYTVL